MKEFFTTIKNIWKIEELRNKILITLLFLVVYRLGSQIPLPGINAAELNSFDGGKGGALVDIINLFTGGAFSQASILALGIMPYISASIVVQLMGMAIPYLKKLQQDGESGRKRINEITRYLTIAICAVQAPGYITLLKTQFLPNPSAYLVEGALFYVPAVLILITGCVFSMWLGEKITERGIGNGISILIMIGIIATLPQALAAEFGLTMEGGNGPIFFLIEIVVWLAIILFCIWLVNSVRKVPVQYARRMQAGSTTSYFKSAQQAARSYIPLKVSATGVMPIIFAQAIMTLPIFLFSSLAEGEPDSIAATFAREFSDIFGFYYNFAFAVLIIVFTFFYTAVTIQTNQMADDLKRNGGFIPGVKPGVETADFLDLVLSRITLPGAILLALVAILPAFANLAGVGQGFAMFFGGTSLLIMVGVVLDTLQQINAYLLNNHYDGLMESGRTKK